MKYTAHVPVEQYGFIEVELDGTAEDIAYEYQKVAKAFKGGAGIDSSKFNEVLDEYLSTGKVQNGGDVWEDMSELQRAIFQEIKKSIKRREK